MLIVMKVRKILNNIINKFCRIIFLDDTKCARNKIRMKMTKINKLSVDGEIYIYTRIIRNEIMIQE